MIPMKGPVLEVTVLSIDQRPASHLPTPLSSFIGRGTQVARLCSELPRTRLLTLTGPGGVGKTRLALQVAAQLIPQFPDGIFLTELASVTDPSLVPSAFASTLGVTDQPAHRLAQTLADALASRRCLLVIDNCEHLTQACAEIIEGMLRAAPSVRVLATSRESLGISGEVVWPVPSLELPDELAAQAVPFTAASEAELLFVERAIAARPAFELTDRNRPVIAEICRQLDGIALAIELAAARVRVLPVEEIANRLSDRFRLLTGGSRTASPRQQTLRATVEWSYDLLPQAEAQLFARLSVFAGGWTLDAAEAIAAEPSEVLDLLTRLVDKSLVLAEADLTGSLRYRLLETLRQFGLERLEASGTGDEVRSRHAAFFLALTEPARMGYGAPDLAARLQPLRREQENLRMALRWLIDTGDAAAAQQLGVAQIGLWNNTGQFGEGRAWLAELLAMSSASAVTATHATLHTGAGLLAWAQADAVSAQQHLETSLSYWRELESDFWVVHALLTLGMVARARGEPAQAQARLAEAAAKVPEVDSLALQSNILHAHGLLAFDAGEYASARSLASQALDTATRARWDRMVSRSLGLLGEVSLQAGDLEAARGYLEQGRAFAREKDDRWAEAGLLTPMTRVAMHQGRLHDAAVLLAESVRHWRDLGNRPELVRVLELGGQLAAELGQSSRASALRAAATRARDTSTSLDDAIAIALELGQSPAPAATNRSGVRGPDDLTPREREVAILVADGLTNRQIAQRLIITEKTAANHVAHVLDKLGLHSRTQLAAQAAAYGLSTHSID
jgi:predicted ATPase/DNA-binding CsgD family transcriptional regulator